jgi:hypothetical protein
MLLYNDNMLIHGHNRYLNNGSDLRKKGND